MTYTFSRILCFLSRVHQKKMDPEKQRVIVWMIIVIACVVSLICAVGVFCSFYTFQASSPFSEAWSHCIALGTEFTLAYAALSTIIVLVCLTFRAFWGRLVGHIQAATFMAENTTKHDMMQIYND